MISPAAPPAVQTFTFLYISSLSHQQELIFLDAVTLLPILILTLLLLYNHSFMCTVQCWQLK